MKRTAALKADNIMGKILRAREDAIIRIIVLFTGYLQKKTGLTGFAQIICIGSAFMNSRQTVVA